MIRFILFLLFVNVKEFLASYSLFFSDSGGFYGIIKDMHTKPTSAYVHIPFCTQICFYCDFSKVFIKNQPVDAYLDHLIQEFRREEITHLRTLYIGGGTPTALSADQLAYLLKELTKSLDLSQMEELTIEANPGDLDPDKIAVLKDSPVNRVSLGVQTFDNRLLKKIGRSHQEQDIYDNIDRLKLAGFDNISIDLIYALPTQTMDQVKENVAKARALDIPHMSLYSLILENHTVFMNRMRRGKLPLPKEELEAEMFEYIIQELERAGFEHYEISNFAKNSKYSLHNTSYWQQQKYVGFGPAAHSFDLNSRQWNVAHLKSYIDNLANDRLSFEKEILTDKDKFNEYIMTNLRTMWGIQEEKVQLQFPDFSKTVRPKLAPFLENGSVVCQNGRIRLTEKGWLVSDDVFSDLFVV